MTLQEFEEKRKERKKSELEFIEKLSEKYKYNLIELTSKSDNPLMPFGYIKWDLEKIEKKMLPCPCCGHKAFLNEYQDVKTDEVTYTAICENDKCELETKECDYPFEPLLIWNQRVS